MEARVVGLGLQDEHRREGARHPVAHGQIDDLLDDGGVGGRLRLPVEEAVDLGLRPGALHQRRLDGPELRRAGTGADRDARRTPGVRELGVDRALLAGHDTVERLRPPPRGALHRDGHARAGGEAEPLRQRRGVAGVRDVGHDPGVGQAGRHHAPERGVVAHAAERDGVEAVDARAAERERARDERVVLRRAGRGDAVGEQHDAGVAVGLRRAARPVERPPEVGGAERAAPLDPRDLVRTELAGRAVVHGLDGLIEAGDADGGGRAGLLHDAGNDSRQGRQLPVHAEGAGGARVDQDERPLQRLRRPGDLGTYAQEDEAAGGDPVAVAADRRDDDVLGHDALPVQRDERLLAVSARHGDVEPPELGQAAERELVGRARRDLLRVRDDELLGRAGRDGEHARGELAPRRLLEQRRVLLPVQEVLVGPARPLELDDLALLPRFADLHREAAHARPRRYREAEGPLQGAGLGVVEDEAHLREGERLVQDDSRREAREAKAGAVGRREGHARLGTHLAHPGLGDGDGR